MTDRFFEDFQIGETFNSAAHRFSEEEIRSFARLWDPQPFHVDPDFAKSWHYGKLIASGLHTMCVSFRLILDLEIFKACNLGSPGFDAIRFPRPVFPDDTIRVALAIQDLRASASRPDRGIVRLGQKTTNQRGELVMDVELTQFLKRRAPGDSGRFQESGRGGERVSPA